MALSDLLGAASRVLVFTGAGISTGSGIPSFRGKDGVWKTRQPVMFQDFLNSEAARVEHWEYKVEGYEAFMNAKPNAAHMALVDLEKLGKLHMLVTQNIDGLHHLAGNNPEQIIEVHGTNRKIECLSCGVLTDPPAAIAQFKETGQCPRCHCGGPLKPATISFGQAMPQDKMARAFEAAGACDLVLAIGSTLEVHPAASVPLMAARRQVPYCIINLGDTAHDEIATLRIEGDAAKILPAALQAL